MNGEVVWVWERANDGVTWSESLAEVFGHPPARPGRAIEQSYRWWRSHVHPSERDGAAAALHRAVTGGSEAWRILYRFRCADGRYAEVLDRGQVVRDGDGPPLRLEARLLDLDRLDPPAPPVDSARLRTPPVPPTPDVRLMEWIGMGDEWALEALWERHVDQLTAEVRALTGSGADADEIVTDTFIQAWTTADSFEPDRGSVGAWLSSMARSRAHSRTRKRRRRRGLLESWSLDARGGRSTESRGEEVLRRATLQKALRRLPSEQRAAVRLSFLRELTHPEIAARLSIPLGTVKYRIRAGLATIRDHL